MDRVSASGAENRGSTPLGRTKNGELRRMVRHWFRKPAGEIPCRFESCTHRYENFYRVSIEVFGFDFYDFRPCGSIFS